MSPLTLVSTRPLAHALGWTLLHFCWQGTLVGALLWCALRLLGCRRCHARYVAACAALALAAVFPVVTFARLAEAACRAARLNDGAAFPFDPTLVIQAAAGAASLPWSARAALLIDHVMPWLLLIWTLGVAFCLARLVAGLMTAQRMKFAGLSEVSAELQRMFEGICARLGVGRVVRIAHSAVVDAPAVIGWLRPVVLLPASCLTGLSPGQIEAILCHELAHVRRHDYLISVFQSVVESLLFYHPAVWWISQQLRRERECCCDEFAIASGSDRLAYARALSVLEQRRLDAPQLALAANGGVLKMRIARLLGRGESVPGSQAAAALVLLALAIGGLLWVGATARAQLRSAARAPLTLAVKLGLPVRHEVELLAAPPLTDQIAPPSRIQYNYTVEPQVARGTNPADRPGPAPTARLLAAAAAAPQRSAQQATSPATSESTGSIAGVIADPTGAMVPRARVKVVNTDTGATTSTTTDSGGRYSFAALPAGPYILEVEAKGFQNLLQENLRVGAGKGTDIGLRLSVGAVHQALTVESSAVAPPPPPDASFTPHAPVAGKPVRVSSGVEAGMAISMPTPVYPAEARAAKIQGVVVLHAIISKTGEVEDLAVVSGPPMLTASALDAVRQWRYKPYLLNGEPTAVETTITVNYALAGEPTTRPTAGPGPVSPFGPAGPSANVPIRIATAAAKTDAAGDRVYKVGGGVISPRPIYTVEPEFTDAARKAKLSGTVVVSLIVDKEGNPEDVHVVRDDFVKTETNAGAIAGMDQQAVDAVSQYRFKPATEDGGPVAVDLNVEVNFRIF